MIQLVYNTNYINITVNIYTLDKCIALWFNMVIFCHFSTEYYINTHSWVQHSSIPTVSLIELLIVWVWPVWVWPLTLYDALQSWELLSNWRLLYNRRWCAFIIGILALNIYFQFYSLNMYTKTTWYNLCITWITSV